MDYVIISKKERLLMRDTLGLMAWSHGRIKRYASKNKNNKADADFKHLVEVGFAKKDADGGYSLTAEGIAFIESDIGAKVIL